MKLWRKEGRKPTVSHAREAWGSLLTQSGIGGEWDTSLLAAVQSLGAHSWETSQERHQPSPQPQGLQEENKEEKEGRRRWRAFLADMHMGNPTVQLFGPSSMERAAWLLEGSPANRGL